MLSRGKGKNNTDTINHATEQVETCFVIAWSPFLNFYLTSCGDFLFQVERGFLLLRTSEAFHMPEPRCHLRESQDLSANEWEEMAKAFTQHASRWIITHVLHFRVKYQGSVFSAWIWFSSNILAWPIEKNSVESFFCFFFQISLTLLPAPPVQKQGPIWPRPSVYWDSCSDDLGPSAGSMNHSDFRWSRSASNRARDRWAFVFFFLVF